MLTNVARCWADGDWSQPWGWCGRHSVSTAQTPVPRRQVLLLLPTRGARQVTTIYVTHVYVTTIYVTTIYVTHVYVTTIYITIIYVTHGYVTTIYVTHVYVTTMSNQLG